ncbi:MAG: helix-turn-helix domain-containing protein [Ilumatobacteraceae bacterium]
MTFGTESTTASTDPLREQLLDAAARAFAERGYSGTRISDIVKSAGLSSGAVYGRFGSKDELLTEAVIRKVERGALEWDFEERLPRSSPNGTDRQERCPTLKRLSSRHS